MNVENQIDSSIPEEAEPITPDELILNLLQDLVAGNPPDDLASEFVEDFVMQDRPEATQVLQMFDTPSATIVEILKGVIGQSYQIQMDALETRGEEFIDGLKYSIKQRMTELASDPA
jgi:hypothetical protein